MCIGSHWEKNSCGSENRDPLQWYFNAPPPLSSVNPIKLKERKMHCLLPWLFPQTVFSTATCMVNSQFLSVSCRLPSSQHPETPPPNAVLFPGTATGTV